jgi:hypothetical protein
MGEGAWLAISRELLKELEEGRIEHRNRTQRMQEGKKMEGKNIGFNRSRERRECTFRARWWRGAENQKERH